MDPNAYKKDLRNKLSKEQALMKLNASLSSNTRRG